MIGTNELVILEMIIIDDRYSDIKNVIGCDDERKQIVNRIIRNVLKNSSHESTFQTFVNIELQSLYEEIA